MPLNLTEIAPDATDEQDAILARSTDRDPDQVDMDKRVEAIKGEWEGKGKPAHGKQNPFRRISVPKDERSEVKRLIRRATVLHGVDPAYWKDTKPDAQGRVTIKFGVQTKKVKADANGSGTPAATATAEQPNTEPPATDPNADQGGEQPQAAPTPGGLFGRKTK